MGHAIRIGGVVTAAALAAGCAHPRLQQAVDSHAASTSSEMDRLRRAFDEAVVQGTGASGQEVAIPWLAGAPQPLERDAVLPAPLRASVDTALMFSGGDVDLATLGEQITLATGLPVRIEPEALLPAALFMPRLSGPAGDVADGMAAVRLAPQPGPQPLASVLDRVAARLGIYWSFEQGAIRFFRSETRVFNVRALTLRASAQASLGRTGTATGGFDSASATRISSEGGDALAAVRAKLEPFLTRAGIVAANGEASGLVVVTDTPAALARIGRYLDQENKAMTRRVRLVFEEIELVARHSNEHGIDWSLVYERGRAVLGGSSPESLLGAAAGRSLDASSGSGRWEGSSLLIRALSDVATVVRRTTVPLQTLNRRPVTHAVRTTFSYIDQVQVTTVASSAGTSTAPSVTQKEETVGTFLTVIPDAQDDGQILLSIAYDSTVAQPLKTLAFGASGSQVQIQQKTVDGMGTVQQVELRPGQPVVISGFERSQDQYDKRRLDDDAPLLLGGSGRVARNRTTTVVIVTAQVEEGF